MRVVAVEDQGKVKWFPSRWITLLLLLCRLLVCVSAQSGCRFLQEEGASEIETRELACLAGRPVSLLAGALIWLPSS